MDSSHSALGIADRQLGGPSSTGYAAEPVDIWGMGVVLYTLLVGSESR